MLATLVFVLVALSRLSSTNSFQNAKLMQNSLKHPAQFGQLSRFGNANALKMSEENSEEGGTEMKYVYAAGVVMFGILWDFFITHGGQPYLVHPQ